MPGKNCCANPDLETTDVPFGDKLVNYAGWWTDDPNINFQTENERSEVAINQLQKDVHNNGMCDPKACRQHNNSQVET